MALRQCIMLLAIVLASATVAAAAPAQLHYSSHLAVLHEMLVAGAADPTNELTVPLPNPLSPSGAAAANVAAGNSDNATDSGAIFAELRLSPYASDENNYRFIGRTLATASSAVRLTVSRTSLWIDGAIINPDGTRFVYTTDVNTVDGSPALAVWKVTNHDPPIQWSDTDHDEAVEATETDPSVLHDRHRRAGPASADRTICTLFVDIDRTFLQHWGGVHTDEDIALVKVRDWVADVEAVYSTRLPMLDFVAVGFKIHSSLTPFLPASPTGTDLLVFYQRWLATDLDNPVPIRGDGFLRPNNVCVNVLLAHVNVNGIVGAAYTGNPVSSIYGGICDNRAAVPLGGAPLDIRLWNVAVVSTLVNDVAISGDTAVRALAHELGHTAGASHTCCLGGGCAGGETCEALDGTPCNPTGNYYLMHPQLTYGSNSLSFSSCSVTAIETLVAAKGSCLLNGAELAALLRPTTSTTSPTTVSTTAMPTTTASASCPPVVDAISCYYNCRGNGYSFSLHFASYKGCAGVCLCSNTGEVEPSLQSSTTSALPSEEVTLVECPSCSLSDLPKKVKTVNSNKSGAIKFKFKAASCPAGHVFTACIQRRNGSGKIKGNVKVSGTKIGKILLRRHENKKCWQMVVPPGLAEDGTKIQFKAKSKGPSFDLQTDLRVVSKAKHCTDV